MEDPMKFTIFNSIRTGLAVFILGLSVSSCEDENEKLKMPAITTLGATEIGQVKATCSGSISADNELINYAGICWSINPDPTTNDNKYINTSDDLTFSHVITNLIPGTKYYFCAFANHDNGDIYGEIKSFTTLGQTYVEDIDGNLYKTLIIGEQEWMIENLKTKTYNNGDAIETTDPGTLDIFNDIYTENLPKYQWVYDGNENNVNEYGLLYTWYAIMDERNVCPVGWHIPSNEEWIELIDEVGGQSFGAWSLKEPGTQHWAYEDTAVKNTSGFTGVGGGRRHPNGTWQELKHNGYWWSSTEEGVYSAMTYSLNASGSNVSYGPLTKSFGISVRCIKD